MHLDEHPLQDSGHQVVVAPNGIEGQKLIQSENPELVITDIIMTSAGDLCPECGGALIESRGIEIGNIFHLGDRYSRSMEWTYLRSFWKSWGS